MADRLSQYPMVPPPFNSSMLQQQLSQSQQQSQVDSQSVSFSDGNPMLQPFSSNNPAHMSRLDLMDLTHNQQSQNTFATRIVQQSQHQANINSQPGQNQPSQPDPFLSPRMAPSDGIRRSPSQSTQPPGSVGKHPRPMTFPELRERAQQLQSVIHQLGGVTMQLSNHRAGMSDADYILRMQATANEIKGHKDMLAKVIQALSQAAPQPNTNGPSGGNIGNLNGTSPQSQQQSGPVQVSQSQSQWMSRPGSSPPQGFGSTASHGPSQSHNIQPSPLQLHAQLNFSQPQNMVPPRPVPPPQQLLPEQIPRQVSPTIANQYSLQTSGHSNAQPRSDQSPQVQFMQMPPALEKARFDTAYKSYCNSKGIKHDTRLMSVDNRPIDLHLLHSQVMEEGGVTKVNQKELWAIIGTRMGFVQFPGTESELAKSGPGVAQHLAHVYKEYLSSFDNVYIQSVIDSKRKMQAQSGASQNTPRTITTPQQMQALIAYANLPAHELRKKGLVEKFIQFVEANRDWLQHSAKMQRMWQGNLVKPSLPGSSGPEQEQDRTMSDPSAPFRKVQAQAGALQNTPRTIMNAQQMQALIANANLPAHELRKKGVSEKFIQFVEANRDQLQHSAKMQQTWRGNLVKPGLPGSSGPEQVQDRTMSDPSAPFPQQNPNLPPSLQHPGSRPGQYVSP